jgi:ring-1,2-phenylacetyl-CoA epoxidase subunit PaaD
MSFRRPGDRRSRDPAIRNLTNAQCVICEIPGRARRASLARNDVQRDRIATDLCVPMNSAPTLTRQHILDLLENVKDPEVPVISVRELGVLRDVEVTDGKVLVTITPTYTGCPAMDTMREDIVKELHHAGIMDVEVKQILSPAWTTDWISDAGKAKLKAYGIAPPEKTADIRALKGELPMVPCPQCGSKDTVMVSAFGSTACKALWKCKTCLEPFDQFKCL